MAFELKDGQGTLFKNDKKGNDKAPDYRGETMMNGTMHKVAGWIKQGKNGPWMSLKFEPKDDEPTRAPAADKRVAADGPGDDIPF